MRQLWVIGIAAALAACASAAPDSAEIQTMRAAPKPSSQEAAQKAVQTYYNGRLFDGPSARYNFPLAPALAAVGIGKSRRAGWLICGQVNGKNRMGGYTGFVPFIAYFSTVAPDLVYDGLVGDDDQMRSVVSGWCDEAYKNRSG